MTNQDLIHHLETNRSAIASHLNEESAVSLLFTLATQDEAIAAAYHSLEACHIVSHSFRLCQDVSKALKVLKVKGEADEVVAKSRLAMFAAAKSVLCENMRLLGLVPLDQM